MGGPPSGTTTPMMSPAPAQDSMGGYSMGSGSYEQQQPYDGSMGYDHNIHQDLSPWGSGSRFYEKYWKLPTSTTAAVTII